MELDMVMEVRIGDKEMVMVKSMVLENRKDKEEPMDHLVLKAIPITPSMKLGELVDTHHPGVLVVAWEAMLEMGVIRVMMTRKSIKVPNMILRI